MSDVNSLKNEARKAEQRGDWSGAISLYWKAIELGETGQGSPDLSLHNRVGDIHLRLGDITAAVSAYETAVDRYTEQELFPSAIAVCKKILRTASGHPETYLRLARLQVRTGLFSEARNNFLEYARRLEERGRLDEALDVLKELIELSGDEAGRLKLAEHLFERDRVPEAIEQLGRIVTQRRERGEDVEPILKRMREMEPPQLDARSLPGTDPSLDLESELLEAKQGLTADGAKHPPSQPAQAGELAELGDRLSSKPNDHVSRVRYAQLLAASARYEEARLEFERALDGFEADGQHVQVVSAVEELLTLDPGDLSLHLRRIAAATRLDDEGVLINAYLQLGGCIEKRLSTFSLRLLSSSSSSGDVSAVFDVVRKTAPNI